MIFDFEKLTYEDLITLIPAQNLNDIQDAILALLGQSDGNEQVYKAEESSGSAANFDAPSAGLPLDGLKVNIVPEQSGSGDPSPSNIRQFVSRTSVKVYHAGKNIYVDEVTPSTVINPSGVPTENTGYSTVLTYIPVVGGESYSFQFKVDAASAARIIVAFYDENKAFQGDRPYATGTAAIGLNTGTVQAPSYAKWMRISLPKLAYDLQIEKGTTASEYESPAKIITISFPTEAGSVYGGELDVTKGKLTVNWTAVDMGTLQYWAYSSVANAFTFHTVGRDTSAANKEKLYSERYKTQIDQFYARIENGCIMPHPGDSAAGILRDSNFSTPSDVTDENDGLHGVLMCYPVTTETVYQVTPQEFFTFPGENNIWSDAGDVEVTYGAYLELVSEKAFGPKVYHVSKSGNGDYTSFTQCLLDLKDDSTQKIIYVDGGDYDIYQEYQAAGVPVYTGSNPTLEYWDYNVWIPVNTHIIGRGIVRLIWMPDPVTYPELTTVQCQAVSPVNVAGSMILENVEIHCKNGRYCIHDDPLGKGRYSNAVKVYRNVRCYHYINDRKNNVAYGFANTIGMGLDKQMHYLFDRCYFWNEGTGYAFYCHTRQKVDNVTLTEAESSELVLKNCVCKTGRAQAAKFGNSGSTTNLRIRVGLFSCWLSGGVDIIDESGTAGNQNAYDLTMALCSAGSISVMDSNNRYPPKIFGSLGTARLQILKQPESLTVPPSVPFSMYIITNTVSDVTYQWQYYFNNQWNNFVGGNAATLTKTPMVTWNGWKIRCIVTGADGTVLTSNEATLTVNAGAIAQQEASFTSTRAYTVGSYLIVDTNLYKVISPISVGGTITPGTNVTQTTVAAQLTALSN